MKLYSEEEEIINYTSHLTSLIILAILVVPIIIKALILNDMPKFVSFLGYFVAVGLMFLSSTLYHISKNEKIRENLRLLDHCSIYLCIAGTYTPILIMGLKDSFSRLIFVIVWILAIVGILLYVILHKMGKHSLESKISIFIYLGMGWISVFLIKNIIQTIGIDFLIWILLGGIFYTVGVYFYKNNKINFNHAIWHFLIIAGTFSMLHGILEYFNV
ncbi:MAG: hemolysin III family protein [Finegoldia sp.]|nr:hemolysin III family protein [Finegoldia sp.]